jgi:uncharacterized membrane protein
MNKNEFLQKLKDDLSSLSDEERIDALKYYEEYFADAGENMEEELIKEFVSPEDLAEKIQHEMTENTDNKYDNIFNMEAPRAPEPPKLVLEDEIIEFEITKEEEKKDEEVKYQKQQIYHEPKKSSNSTDNALKIILIICTSPVWVPILIALASVAFGLFMALLGISFAVAAVAVAGFIMVGAGFLSVGYGIANIYFDFFYAFQAIGIGFIVAGIGLIMGYGFTKLSAFMFKTQFSFAGKTIHGITKIFTHNNA